MSIWLVLSVIGIVFIGAVVFTLIWWRLADRWADDEHKRFKSKGGPAERVIVQGFKKPGEH
jgi:4-hydroxybenzoate polyprenyltransferase